MHTAGDANIFFRSFSNIVAHIHFQMITLLVIDLHRICKILKNELCISKTVFL